jgi:hypothetical protein
MRDNAFTFRVSFNVTAHLGANSVGSGREPGRARECSSESRQRPLRGFDDAVIYP